MDTPAPELRVKERGMCRLLNHYGILHAEPVSKLPLSDNIVYDQNNIGNEHPPQFPFLRTLMGWWSRTMLKTWKTISVAGMQTRTQSG
jgi:hypothetical protein